MSGLEPRALQSTAPDWLGKEKPFLAPPSQVPLISQWPDQVAYLSLSLGPSAHPQDLNTSLLGNIGEKTTAVDDVSALPAPHPPCDPAPPSLPCPQEDVSLRQHSHRPLCRAHPHPHSGRPSLAEMERSRALLHGEQAEAQAGRGRGPKAPGVGPSDASASAPALCGTDSEPGPGRAH